MTLTKGSQIANIRCNVSG